MKDEFEVKLTVTSLSGQKIKVKRTFSLDQAKQKKSIFIPMAHAICEIEDEFKKIVSEKMAAAKL